MATVETVQGPIDVSDLGVTLPHEHVRFSDEAVRENWPSRYDPEAEMATALEAVRAALDRGVQTIVEPTAMFGGRDVRFMREVSGATGMQIVPCTGIYTYDYLPLYFQSRSEDVIAQHFVDDITKGIQGTDIKAAFLKCAADEAGVTPNVEKVHRAVARASLQTGAPIMAHSMPRVNTGPRQLDIFEEEGVDLSRVVMAHTGDTEDLDYIEAIIARGAYAGLDRYGIEMYLPIDKRNVTLAELLRRGHAGQLHVAQDFCASIDWFEPEVAQQLMEAGMVRNWSMTLVFDEVIPAMQEQGVWDDDVFRTIFVDNPARWLAG